VSETSSIDERVEEIEREFYDDRQQRDTKRAVTALARALAEAERERNELRASIAYTVQVVNSQLDATFAAEDQAAERLEISRNEWKARAIAAEAKAAKDADCYEKNYKLIGELEELQKDLKRAKSDLSTSAARLSEAYRVARYRWERNEKLQLELVAACGREHRLLDVFIAYQQFDDAIIALKDARRAAWLALVRAREAAGSPFPLDKGN
jgi:hypothetical protein